MIKLTVLASILTKMELYIKASGKKTNNMEKVQKIGQTVHFTKECILKAKSTAKVILIGLMAAATKVRLLRTTWRATAYTDGLMAECTKANGKTTRCTEAGISLFLMVKLRR